MANNYKSILSKIKNKKESDRANNNIDKALEQIEKEVNIKNNNTKK